MRYVLYLYIDLMDIMEFDKYVNMFEELLKNNYEIRVIPTRISFIPIERREGEWCRTFDRNNDLVYKSGYIHDYLKLLLSKCNGYEHIWNEGRITCHCNKYIVCTILDFAIYLDELFSEQMKDIKHVKLYYLLRYFSI